VYRKYPDSDEAITKCHNEEAMTEYRRFNFDSRKFKELMLYFSRRGTDEGLVIGSTKLNKLLFFSDFQAYAELGEPVTGARYQKLEFGPAARELVPMRNQLLSDHEVDWGDRADEDLNDILIARSDPDMTIFSADERRIMDEVFEELRPFNATASADYSHMRSAGWRVVGKKKDIPYESTFVLTDPAPPEAIELGRELAVAKNW
jgi:hypothetical protein